MKKIMKNLFIVLLLGILTLQSFSYAQVNSDTRYQELKKQGDLLCAKEDFSRAALYYSNALLINPNEADFNKLGLIYFMEYDFKNARNCFESSLKLNPNNKKTQAKIRYMNYLIPQKEKIDKFYSVLPSKHAPKKLHNLVKVEGKLKDSKDLDKLHTLIDYIWSDSEGRMILQKAIYADIPIILKNKIKGSHFICEQALPANKQTLDTIQYAGQYIGYSNYIEKKLYVKEDDISNFQENEYQPNKIIYQLNILPIELCELSRLINYTYPKLKFSQKSILISVIVGYDIAYRVFGEQLTEERAREIAVATYDGTILNHKYNYYYANEDDDDARKFLKLGIDMPYYDVYADLSKLKMHDEGNNPSIQKYINELNTILSENYDTLLPEVSGTYQSRIYINKNNKTAYGRLTSKNSSKNIEKISLFNINTALFMTQFPINYKETLVPITYRFSSSKASVKYAKPRS